MKDWSLRPLLYFFLAKLNSHCAAAGGPRLAVNRQLHNSAAQSSSRVSVCSAHWHAYAFAASAASTKQSPLHHVESRIRENLVPCKCRKRQLYKQNTSFYLAVYLSACSFHWKWDKLTWQLKTSSPLVRTGAVRGLKGAMLCNIQFQMNVLVRER